MAPIPIETARFSETARSDLLQLFESVPGKKNLVLQKSLVGPVEALVKFSTLQEYGVDRIFFLENDNVDASQQNVIFIASGEKGRRAYTIAAQVKRVQQASPMQHDFTVFWAPRRTLVCEKVFEEAGVLGDITSLEWPLWLQPVDNNLLSLGLDDSFAELYLKQDPTSLYLSARALMLLQEQHGLFPRMLGKGTNARRLADLLVRMRHESTAGSTSRAHALLPSSTIDSLVIIDRSCDFATPLLTQLTYEGLLDETFGINNAQIEVATSVIGAAPAANSSASGSAAGSTATAPAPLKRKVPLSPSDPLYSSLRSSSISQVGPTLNRVARRLQTDFALPADNKKSVAELRDFVSKLPGYQTEQQSLKIHTSLAEEVLKVTRAELWTKVLEVQQNAVAGSDPSTLVDLVEECIARDIPVETVLRLLCLMSVVNHGIRPKELDSYKRQVVQAYGYEHIVTLSALEKMGLLLPARGGVTSGLSSYIPGVGALTGTISTSSTARASSPAAPSTNTSSSTTTPSAEATNYSAIRKPLHLIIDDVAEADPTDIAYTYSGYAPLSVRLLQCLLQPSYLAALTSASSTTLRKPDATPASTTNTAAPAASVPSDITSGWRGHEDVLRHIKGPTFDISQGPLESDKSGQARQSLIGHGGREGRQKTSVVFFLGGITYAEVAAVRLIAGQLAEGGRRLLVVTTGMIRGDGVVEAAIRASDAKRI